MFFLDDELMTKPVLVPVPIPIYIPAPMAMYSLPVPYPVPMPIPIPVPCFIPTTKKSAAGIMKHINVSLPVNTICKSCLVT